MAMTFIQTLHDETLRLEVGSPVVSDLAVENLELSTPALSRAVRQSVIERRVITAPSPEGAVVRCEVPGPNRLEMYEVALPDAA
jgi:hypothetical protein